MSEQEIELKKLEVIVVSLIDVLSDKDEQLRERLQAKLQGIWEIANKVPKANVPPDTQAKLGLRDWWKRHLLKK